MRIQIRINQENRTIELQNVKMLQEFFTFNGTKFTPKDEQTTLVKYKNEVIDDNLNRDWALSDVWYVLHKYHHQIFEYDNNWN